MARSLRVFWKRHFQGKYQRHVDVMYFTFATVHATDADVTLMTALECIQLKQQSRFITARELPC